MDEKALASQIPEWVAGLCWSLAIILLVATEIFRGRKVRRWLLLAVIVFGVAGGYLSFYLLPQRPFPVPTQ